MSQCGRVCLSAGGCVPVWEGFPIVGGYVPVCVCVRCGCPSHDGHTSVSVCSCGCRTFRTRGKG